MTALVDQGLGVWGRADDLQAQVRLRDRALDKLRQGLCVFDGQRRLLLFNRRYAEMHDLRPEDLWIGMTLEQVTDLSYAAGTGSDMPRTEFRRGSESGLLGLHKASGNRRPMRVGYR